MKTITLIATGCIALCLALSLALYAAFHITQKEAYEIDAELSLICYKMVLLVNETPSHKLEKLEDEAFESAIELVNEFNPEILTDYIIEDNTEKKQMLLDHLNQDKDKALKKLTEIKEARETKDGLPFRGVHFFIRLN
jgi:hypothetical protein